MSKFLNIKFWVPTMNAASNGKPNSSALTIFALTVMSQGCGLALVVRAKWACSLRFFLVKLNETAYKFNCYKAASVLSENG